ncbi:MAG: hypothetical protein JSS81_29480 [Acidobacteria bacterium]|nr:hypothetical protein [Acidobacteriota bacterium]
MKVLRYFLMTVLVVIGFSVAAMAQGQDNNNRPKKPDPPQVVPPDKNRPRDPPPNDNNNSNRPKKPDFAVLYVKKSDEIASV